MKNFTRKYYIDMWNEILTTYQWWGTDLVTLRHNIKETNPIIFEVFDKLYKKQKDTYVPRAINKTTKFYYQKLNKLIPTAEKLNTKLTAKSLNKNNNFITFEEHLVLKRSDYLIAIVCFMEEFVLLNLNDGNMVSETDNILAAHSENIDIFVEYDMTAKKTLVRIIIPCELVIEYESANL